MQTATYVLFVMLQFGGPNPNNSYGTVALGGAATTAEFTTMEKCGEAAQAAHGNFASSRVLVTTFCTAK